MRASHGRGVATSGEGGDLRIVVAGAVALDGQLAGAAPARFAVGVEDGRAFAQCVLASLNTDTPGPRRRYVYCLRCEGVTAP